MNVSRILVFLLFSFQIAWLCDGRGFGPVKTAQCLANYDDWSLDKPKTSLLPELKLIQKLRQHVSALFKQCQTLEAGGKSVIEIYSELQQEECASPKDRQRVHGENKRASKIPIESSALNGKMSIDSSLVKKMLQIRGGKMIKRQKVEEAQMHISHTLYMLIILACAITFTAFRLPVH
ncbi:hypothetical protein EON63_20875 [archaeon]|nr:MAG: hypothetical protein EON63_20875 [archaeon]